jgi:3-oxoacyl-[acyl-carrier protein] reductase
MNLGIKGKVALVVGASKSIGRAVAEELAREGAYVVAVARSADLLASISLESGQVGECIAMDLMPAGAPEELAERLREKKLVPDIIYYAIGGSFDGIRDTASHSAAWAKVWRFNLGIAVDLNNAFLPDMVARKWGRIVMTSSDATKCNSGNVPYTSSKFALEGYVKVASKQYAKDGVIISAVSPGPIYTEGRFLYTQSPEDTEKYFDKYLPIRRFGQAEEVAKTVAFLCSEHSSFMPGAIVDVHGGSR